ncbi:MAG: hypothetical protein Q3979_00985 [Actinomycetaceae bacterium]|nr:hypothetical protein [Actinomycetaceae bacterium]
MTRSEDSVLDIIQELVDTVTNARSVPMSASVMVNRAEFLDLLASIRELLPSQVVEADTLLANADSVAASAENDARKIREDAKDEAERIVAAAHEQASRLVSQDAVTVAAKARAQRIVDEAKSQADRLSQGADEYSDTNLRELQEQVADLGNSMDELSGTIQNHIDVLLGQIQAGRDVIAQRKGKSNPEDETPRDEEGSWI